MRVRIGLNGWLLSCLLLTGCPSGLVAAPPCQPGTVYVIGCPSCSGTPNLYVCDNSTVSSPVFCLRDEALASYEAEEYCPSLTVMCPRSGSFAVQSTGNSEEDNCDWDINRR